MAQDTDMLFYFRMNQDRDNPMPNKHHTSLISIRLYLLP